MLRFVQPVQDSVVLSGQVTVNLVVHPPAFNLTELGVFFCIELIYRHGHERSCYLDTPLPWTAKIDGLQAGRMQILATLEQNTSSFDKNNIRIEQLETITISKTSVSFQIGTRSLSPTMQITYPRPQEHLSLGKVDIAMRVGNLPKPIRGGSGYFCATFIQHVGDQTKERSTSKCVATKEKETVLSTDFSNGVHGVSAQLYDENGKMMSNNAAQTSTIFRVTKIDSNHQRGPKHWPKPNGDYSETPSVAARTIHIALMSVRSYNRYHEALVMIKSLLFHRQTSIRIHLHIIVDDPGQIFFEREILSMSPSCLHVTFHPFNEVCRDPNIEFLNKFNFSLSAHYSGHAGYCRLHMPKWFIKHFPNIHKIIAIETDQIFMDDPIGLYNEFQNFGTERNSDAIIGMPEMYKPWRDGRVDGSKDTPRIFDRQKEFQKLTGKKNENENDEEKDIREDRNEIGLYHGNGYIGGIIMLNLKKIKLLETPFNEVVTEALNEFLHIERETDPDWNPQLNDQDIFNAVFTMRPELVYTIDCKWQLQFHAFQESRRLCDGASFFNEDESSCPASQKAGLFLCKKKPGLVHFMAQTYKTRTSGPSYYTEFHGAMAKVPWSLLTYEHLSDRHCGKV